MHKAALITAIALMVAGCATGARYGDGGRPDPYRSTTGSANDWSKPYYDDRYWPPVVPGQAFPPQIMDGGSQD